MSAHIVAAASPPVASDAACGGSFPPPPPGGRAACRHCPSAAIGPLGALCGGGGPVGPPPVRAASGRRAGWPARLRRLMASPVGPFVHPSPCGASVGLPARRPVLPSPPIKGGLAGRPARWRAGLSGASVLRGPAGRRARLAPRLRWVGLSFVRASFGRPLFRSASPASAAPIPARGSACRPPPPTASPVGRAGGRPLGRGSPRLPAARRAPPAPPPLRRPAGRRCGSAVGGAFGAPVGRRRFSPRPRHAPLLFFPGLASPSPGPSLCAREGGSAAPPPFIRFQKRRN